MATTLQELIVKIQGDVSDLKSAMDEGASLVKSGTDEMANAIKKMSSDSANQMGFFRQAAQTALGVFTAEAALHGIEAIGEAIKDFLIDTIREDIKAAKDHEDAITRMNVALASAGNYSQESSEKMQEFAEAMMRATGSEVDATLNAAALIENLTKLDNDGLRGATHAAIELAAVLNIDLQSAAHLVARAIDGQVTGLHRQGIEMDVGANKAENLKNLLDALSDKMHTAESLTNTYSGAMRVLTASETEAHAALGSVFVQNQAVIKVIQEITRIIQEHTDAINEDTDGYKELVAKGIIIVIDALKVMAEVGDIALRTLGVAFEIAMIPSRALAASMLAIQDLIQGNLKDAINEFKVEAVNSFTAITDAAKATKLNEVSDMLGQLEGAAKKGLVAIASGSETVYTNTKKASDAVHQFTEEEQKMAAEGEKIYQAQQKQDPKKKYDLELKELQQANKQKLLSDEQYKDAKEQLDDDLVKSESSIRENEIKQLEQDNEYLKILYGNDADAEIRENNAKIQQILKQEGEGSEIVAEYQKKTSASNKHEREVEAQAAADIAGNLVTVSKAFGRQGFEFGKRASEAQAIINTYQGATKALAMEGPLGIALAASVIAAGMANVATIEAQHLATGLDTVPGIGFGDQFHAVLSPGEGVLDAGTNQGVQNFFSGGGIDTLMQGLKAIADRIDNLSSAIMSSPITVQIGGKTITSTIRDELRRGRAIVV